MQNILKGAPVRAEIEKEIESCVNELAKCGIRPCVASLRIGESDGDIYYERSIASRCEKYGMDHRSVVLPVDTDIKQALYALESLNDDPDVHGIIMLMPFPDSVDEEKMRAALDPDKDIDAISDASYATLFNLSDGSFRACTAESCMQIAKHYLGDITGLKVTIVGRSMRIGRPLSLIMLAENATVTICHSRTRKDDLMAATKGADVVILATGNTHGFDAGYFRDGQMIIDAGTGTDESGNIAGDLDVRSLQNDGPNDVSYTPVPGGVGAVTTTILLRNAAIAALNAGKQQNSNKS